MRLVLGHSLGDLVLVLDTWLWNIPACLHCGNVFQDLQRLQFAVDERVIVIEDVEDLLEHGVLLIAEEVVVVQ